MVIDPVCSHPTLMERLFLIQGKCLISNLNAFYIHCSESCILTITKLHLVRVVEERQLQVTIGLGEINKKNPRL